MGHIVVSGIETCTRRWLDGPKPLPKPAAKSKPPGGPVPAKRPSAKPAAKSVPKPAPRPAGHPAAAHTPGHVAALLPFVAGPEPASPPPLPPPADPPPPSPPRACDHVDASIPIAVGPQPISPSPVEPLLALPHLLAPAVTVAKASAAEQISAAAHLGAVEMDDDEMLMLAMPSVFKEPASSPPAMHCPPPPVVCGDIGDAELDDDELFALAMPKCGPAHTPASVTALGHDAAVLSVDHHEAISVH